MKSLRNLRKGLAFVLCVAMLLGDSILLQAAQVQTLTVGATVSETTVEPEAEVTEEVAEVTEGEPLVAAEEEVPAAEIAEEATTEEKTDETSEEAKEDGAAVTEEVADGETDVKAEDEDAKAEDEAEEEEEEDEEEEIPTTFSAEADGATFTVTTQEGTFAEKVTLLVSAVAVTDELQAELDERAIAEQKAIESVSAYDIKFVNAAGEEVEPAKEVQVTVSTPEVNAGDDASVYHFDEAAASVEDMDAAIVNGDVAFDTTHFSTYVIVNKGQNTVTVKIHHVDQAGNEIYSMDERKIAVGARVVDYNKAANWEVSCINRDSVNGNQISAETLANGITSDMEIWVHYTPKNQEFTGDVTAWDYVVQPNGETAFRTYRYDLASGNRTYHYYSRTKANSSRIRLSNTWYNISNETEVTDSTYEGLVGQINADNRKMNNTNAYDVIEQTNTSGATKSINTKANYEGQSGYSSNKKYLTVGKTDQNFNENKHDDSYSYGNHHNQKINDYGEGNNAIKYGIVKGLDSNGNVEFNVNEPGIFSTSPSVGKYVYNHNEYSLKFAQTGDTYQLTSVRNNSNGHEVAAGRDFFLMQDAASYVQDGANSGGQNDFFGMRYDVQFTIGDYVGDLKYRFAGDDDLWVILDGNKVVIDLGGIHQVQEQEVDLWQYIDGGKTGCDRTKEHKLTILYMERGAVASNCEMKFTLPNAQVVDYTTPLANLDILKVDEDDNTPLAGATFKLQYSDASIERTVTTGEDGKAHFGDLIEGTYTLTETAAPDEYDLTTESWIVKVTVSADQKTATATLYKADGTTKVPNNTITNKKTYIPPVISYNKSKTVKVTNYNNREYEITLEAQSTTQQSTHVNKSEAVDVMLLLDVSGSMKTQDVTDGVGSYEYAGTYYSESDRYWELYGTYYVLRDGKYYKVTRYDGGGRYYYYYTDDNGSSEWIDNYEELYTYQEAATITRLAALKNSAEQFLTSMSEKSPNSKVGIVTFSSTGYGGQKSIYNLQTIGKDPQAAIASLNGMSANGGTSPELAMNEAQRQFEEANDGRKKIVILFTDGEPTGNHSYPTQGNTADWDSKDASETAASALKQKGVTVYTVGFALSDAAKNWLSGTIATSSGHALTAETQDDLIKIFETISQDITKNLDIENVTIVDVIDPRFELVETPEGATVEGNVITWTKQTLPYASKWTKTIKIRAKADFLGGNKVLTNGADSGIKISEDGELDPFEQPTVNVKLLALDGQETEETVFVGDSIDASQLDTTLAKAIKTNGQALLANPTFAANGTYSMDYSYPGTSDVLGTITFTKKAEGEGAAFTKHTAEYIGSPAERYTVTAEYKPLKVSERPQSLANPAADAGEEVITSATAKAVHKVNVVAGTVKISKVISKKDYKKTYGDPVFTFELKNTTTGKVYYKTLRFTEAIVESSLMDVTISTEITGLPKGNYEVKELDTMGFVFKSLSVDGYNKKVVDEIGSFTLELNHDQATAKYTNKLSHSPRDTDTDVVKNTFVLNGKTSFHTDVDNDGTQDVGKHTTLTNNNEGGNQ